VVLLVGRAERVHPRVGVGHHRRGRARPRMSLGQPQAQAVANHDKAWSRRATAADGACAVERRREGAEAALGQGGSPVVRRPAGSGREHTRCARAVSRGRAGPRT